MPQLDQTAEAAAQATRRLEVREQMMAELQRLDGLHEWLSGKGAVIEVPTGFVSGHPYFLSSDFHRAFRFKDQASAQGFIDKFLLANATARVVQ